MYDCTRISYCVDFHAIQNPNACCFDLPTGQQSEAFFYHFIDHLIQNYVGTTIQSNVYTQMQAAANYHRGDGRDTMAPTSYGCFAKFVGAPPFVQNVYFYSFVILHFKPHSLSLSVLVTKTDKINFSLKNNIIYKIHILEYLKSTTSIDDVWFMFGYTCIHPLRQESWDDGERQRAGSCLCLLWVLVEAKFVVQDQWHGHHDKLLYGKCDPNCWCLGLHIGFGSAVG